MTHKNDLELSTKTKNCVLVYISIFTKGQHKLENQHKDTHIAIYILMLINFNDPT